MISRFHTVVAVVCIFFAPAWAFAMDGRVWPMDRNRDVTNNCALVRIVLACDDVSLPRYMAVGQWKTLFVPADSKASAVARIDCKICVENYSPWPYVLDHSYSAPGYYSAEVDLLLDNGKVACLKRRKPDGLSFGLSSITVKPGKKWECPISLDRRLWSYPPEVSTNKIVKIRPRFAFGVYEVEGKYYRTLDEIGKPMKQRVFDGTFDDREGELIGEWIDYRPLEN